MSHGKQITTGQIARAALYLRKSSEDERSAEDGRSIDRQREHAIAFATSKGWRVDPRHVYADDGISGANFQRPGLVRLLEAASRKEFTTLVVMSVDRIGREQVGTSVVMQQLQRCGVSVWCYQTGERVRFEHPVEKLMLGIQGFGAEDFRYQIKLKTTEALRRKARRGHHAAGVTYGYGLVRVDQHTEREVDPQQARVVRRIFEMSASGMGDSRIVNTLAREGVPAPGRGWAKKTVALLLRNELFVGKSVYGKTATVDDGARGKRVRVTDPSAWVVADVPHLRIVDDALWARVQARKRQTRSHYLRTPDGRLQGKPESGLVSSRILNGIAVCARCGGAMSFMGDPRGKRNRYYCTTRPRRGPMSCSLAHGAPMQELDEAVLDELYDVLFRKPEVVAEMCEARVARMRREQEAQAKPSVDKEVAKLESEIKRLVGFMASGRGAGDLGEAVQERRDRIEELKAAVVAPPTFDRAAFFEEMKFLSGQWMINPLVNPGDPVLVRQVLRRLGVDRVTVHRDDRTGEWTWESALNVGRLLPVGTGPSDPSEKPVLGADLVNTTSGFMDATLL